MLLVRIFEFEHLSSKDALLMELLSRTLTVLLPACLLSMDVEVILWNGVDLVGQIGHDQV